jgi:hypothetical protein
MRLQVRKDGTLTLTLKGQSVMGRYKFVDDTTLEITPAAGTPERYTVEFKGDLVVIGTPMEAWEFKRTD